MAQALRESVFIVTGASSGIGAATAVEAGRAGMRIVLAARRADRLEEVAGRVRSAGGEALVVPTDVSDPEQIERMVDRAMDQYGRIDALFANAGFGHFHEGCSDIGELERRIWAVNYEGTRRSVHAVVPHMKRQGRGHILFCSSLVGVTGLPYYSTYAATKAAQVGLFASLRGELKPEGIEVTCVYPGSTDTEFHQSIADRCGRDAASEATPSLMMQPAEAVARRVVRCLRRPSPEVWPNRFLHLLAGIWAWFPRARDVSFRGMARHGRRVLRELGDGRRAEVVEGEAVREVSDAH